MVVTFSRLRNFFSGARYLIEASTAELGLSRQLVLSEVRRGPEAVDEHVRDGDGFRRRQRKGPAASPVLQLQRCPGFHLRRRRPQVHHPDERGGRAQAVGRTSRAVGKIGNRIPGSAFPHL